MRRGRIPAVVLVLCFSPVAWAADGLTQAPEAAFNELDPQALHLRSGTYKLSSQSSLHRAPVARPADGAAGGHYVVQLNGPLTAQRQQQVEATGLRLGLYLPSYAYIVRVPTGFDLVGKVGALPFVRWIGAFDPAWKIDPEIGLPDYQTTERQALRAAGRVKLTVVSFEGENLEAAAAQLAAVDGVVVNDATQSGDAATFEITMPAGAQGQLAALDFVQWVEEAPELTYRNSTNKWILQTNTNNVTSVWDHGIHGEGQIGGVIDGPVREDHCSFNDPDGDPVGASHRKIIQYNGTAGADGHGTHVCGTFVGDEQPVSGGTANRGMAYLAKLVFTNDSTVTANNLLTRLNTAHTAGARIHTNSWGNDGTTAYITWCAHIDQFSFQNEDDVVAFACTNLNQAIKTPENAKNCLAVVLTNDSPNQGGQCFNVGFAFTNDGRRKPEVAAPGCSTLSSNGTAAGTCSFTSSGFSGNSMASPAAAGAGLLVRQYFMDGFYPSGAANAPDAFTPSGALIRAVLTNSAVDMTTLAGFPSNREGWGRILLENALYFAGDVRKLLVLADIRNALGFTSTGQSHNYNVNVTSAGEPLEITLVWTEKQASVNANPAYINDLNLVVTGPTGTIYRGNDFTAGQSTANSVTTNVKDNTEVVLLSAPAVGSYTVTINCTAKNTTEAQGYALIATGAVTSVLPAPSVSSINPDTAETDTVVNNAIIAGANFQAGATVKIVGPDLSEIDATGVSVDTAAQITCDLDLTGALVGDWDVVVTNPDAQSASLLDGFAVTITCQAGDMNDDGLVDGDDAQKFVDVVILGTGTQREMCAADMDGNTAFDVIDVDKFIMCLLDGGCL